jgi:uncharacterized membrane protein
MHVMNEHEQAELFRRLEALENEVRGLKNAPGAFRAVPPPALPPPLLTAQASLEPPPLPGGTGAAATPVSSAFDRARTLLNLENILSKIGIGLLILGVILLLKYSIDQGWFTATVKTGIGLALAAGLWVAGLRLLSVRPALGQTLVGGGLAVYYATVFAAVQLFQLTGPLQGFIAVLFGTVAGFTVSLRRDIQVPAVIALAGGLAAPFLLDSGKLAVVPVVVYSLLILAGAAVAYQRKNWQGIFWTGLAGGVLVFLALEGNISTVSRARLADQFALQMALAAWWAAHALLPGQRLRRNPGESTTGVTLHVVAFLLPVLAVTAIIEIWSLGKFAAGWVALGTAALYFLGARALDSLPLHRRGHRLASGLLAASGLLLIFDGDAAFFVAVALSVGLAEAARRTREALIEAGSQAAAAVLAVWWIIRAFDPAIDPPLMRLDALVQLAAVIALLRIWSIRPEAWWRGAYWVAGIVFSLAWIAREAALSEQAMAWTSAGWGSLALGLLVASVLRWNVWFRRTGLALLLVVVAKLLIVDMASVAAIWRIILFMGLGGLMLLVSYVLPRLAAKATATEVSPGQPPPLP